MILSCCDGEGMIYWEEGGLHNGELGCVVQNKQDERPCIQMLKPASWVGGWVAIGPRLKL